MVVRFTKTSTSKSKSADYPSTLVLDGAGLVASESDDVTESNLAKMEAAAAEWRSTGRFGTTPERVGAAPAGIESVGDLL